MDEKDGTLFIDLSDNISLNILSRQNIDVFLEKNSWINRESFFQICSLYNFPEDSVTAVIQYYYIDAAYRDIYYNYWARFHFSWPRHCKRVILFQNAHGPEEFYRLEDSDDNYDILQKDFLGTITIRPSYVHGETEHTIGRTLLNPYKMKIKEGEGYRKPFLYIITTEYKIHLLEHTYTTFAFPFSSQDGIAMKCAETAIYCLGDYGSAASSLYSRILPSDIQEKLKNRVPERILPSHGLYCSDISYVLKEFGYSPMIYASVENYEKAEKDSVYNYVIDECTGSSLNELMTKAWKDREHITNFENWFHYYVDSAIPILAVTSPRQDAKKHATLVIGHGTYRKSVADCTPFKLGDFPCVDTSQLYKDYIIIDDNQIPYVEEEMGAFTLRKDHKLEAFIVPLEKHVFLEASSAVSICDTFIEKQKERIKIGIALLMEKCYSRLEKEKIEENKNVFHQLIENLQVSLKNPLTIRYYLANSVEFKQYRIKNASNIEEKRFYAGILMPKLVWIAEISTLRCYEMGFSFGEIVLDATASSRSKVDSIILIRMISNGVYRLPEESYSDFEGKFGGECENCNLSGLFEMYSNFRRTFGDLLQ